MDRQLLTTRKMIVYDLWLTLTNNGLASEKDADSTCMPKESPQCFGLKYVPLSMQRNDIHFHLKFMMENHHKEQKVFQTAAMTWWCI